MQEAIDPQTGSLLASRRAFVRLTNKSIRDAGFNALPHGKADGNPWVVIYMGLGGREQKTKVSEVKVDRTFDAIDCFLEPYK
jgi:hypothetical protein